MSTSRKAPLLERQAVYWSTGAAAGVAASLAVAGAHRIIPTAVAAAPIKASALRSALAGAGMRFLAFDLCRDFLKKHEQTIPVSLRGGLAGCAGGIAETLQSHLFTALSTRNRPFFPSFTQNLGPALLSHGSTLFLCFGGYTFLSNTFSPSQIPPSIPLCFFLGGLAGAIGVPAVHTIKNKSLKGAAMASATGFVRVGTVIGCQVISSARIVEWLEKRR